MTAADIARGVRSGGLKAVAVVDAALERIERTEPAINAFTSVVGARARARAAEIDRIVAGGGDPGPLAGVPFAAKNLFDIAGLVTRAGAFVTREDMPAVRDAAVIAAWERDGAVLVGATNMDEFAYGFTTENAHDGTTRNPHDRSRVAGGSSGGSAAAVAAGVVPLALGSDTNGSIRVPSAVCGIFGLRPTFGGISRDGAYPFVNSLDTIGPFARTAADLALAVASLCPAAASPAPSRPLRVARLGGYFDTGLAPAARAAVDRVAQALDVVGPHLVISEAQQAREAAFLMTGAEAGELHAARLREHYDEYDPATRDRLLAGALMPAQWYVRAQRFRSLFRAIVREVLETYDVLLAPATPWPATTVGQATIALDGIVTEVRSNVGVFTQPITLAGVPVVAVPIVLPGALPVGVQLIGRPNGEAMLLTLAADLESRGVVGAGDVPLVA
jgi:aspartyl-tRNA(Asn)/glutamyl-tRNA(Gln) amidotransferase subunit A